MFKLFRTIAVCITALLISGQAVCIAKLFAPVKGEIVFQQIK